MAKETVYNNTLVSGAADETLTYTRYVKDESSGKSTKELLEEKVNKTDKLGTTQLENESVTAEKLAENSVDGRKVCDGSIENRHIGNSAISTSKIASRSVTNEKIAHNSVSRAELTPDVRTSIDKKADAEQVNNSLYDLEKKIGDRFVVEGDVTNLPDEEDLTSVKESERDVLKLADRSYAPEKFSGKGYKILRRNIKLVSIAVTKIRVESVSSADGTLSFTINGKEAQVAVSASTDNTTALVAQKVASSLQELMTEYEVLADASIITLTRKSSGSVTPSVFSASTTGVVCTITDSTKREFRNILTPIMINQPNTIYEIRYDFELGEEEITIKEGCTLKFNGGSLKNGTVVCNNTNITSIYTNSLFDNIIFNGSFGEFDFKYLRNKDITTLLQFTLDNIHYAHLPEGNFYISSPIVINNTGTIIQGEGRHNTYLEYIGGSNIENLIETRKKTTESYYAIQMNTIRDIYLKGNNKVNNCINNQGPSCLFENLYITEFKENGIVTNNSWCTHINNNIITYCGTGIYLEGASHSTCIFENRIEDNKIYDIRITSSADVSIRNNVLESECKTSILVLSCRNLNIKENYFEGSRIMKGSEIVCDYAKGAYTDKTTFSSFIMICNGSNGKDTYANFSSAYPTYNANIENNHIEGGKASLVTVTSCMGLKVNDNNIQNPSGIVDDNFHPMVLIPYVFNTTIYNMEVLRNTCMIKDRAYKAEPIKCVYPDLYYFVINNSSYTHIFGSCKIEGESSLFANNINDWNILRTDSVNIPEYKINNFSSKKFELLLTPTTKSDKERKLGFVQRELGLGLFCFEVDTKYVGDELDVEDIVTIEMQCFNKNGSHAFTKKHPITNTSENYTKTRLYINLDSEFVKMISIIISCSKTKNIVSILNPKLYKIGDSIPDNNYYLATSTPYQNNRSQVIRTIGIPVGTIVSNGKEVSKICTVTAEDSAHTDTWKEISTGLAEIIGYKPNL